MYTSGVLPVPPILPFDWLQVNEVGPISARRNPRARGLRALLHLHTTRAAEALAEMDTARPETIQSRRKRLSLIPKAVGDNSSCWSSDDTDLRFSPGSVKDVGLARYSLAAFVGMLSPSYNGILICV